MDQALELILKYPLIQSSNTENNDVTLFQGKIFVVDRDYTVSVKQTRVTTHTNCKYELINVEADDELVQQISKCLEKNHYKNITEVLENIEHLIKSRVVQTNCTKNYCNTYQKVLHEYFEFTKFFLNLKTCILKEDLTEVFVSILDEKNREHSTKMSVIYSEHSTDIFQLTDFDLPMKNQDVFKPNDSLTALFNQFLGQIELLQPYFDIMEELDKNCSILDPGEPKRRDFYRRIWLGDNISTIITVDPFNIFLRPDIRFLGPNRLVDKYSTQLNESICNWTCENGIYKGILDLLGLDHFPQRETTQMIVDLLVAYGECSICFCLRLNDKLPEIICPNKCCEKFYHSQCLYEWLISLNAKRIFNNVSGNCPNCEKTITCPVLD